MSSDNVGTGECHSKHSDTIFPNRGRGGRGCNRGRGRKKNSGSQKVLTNEQPQYDSSSSTTSRGDAQAHGRMFSPENGRPENTEARENNVADFAGSHNSSNNGRGQSRNRKHRINEHLNRNAAETSSPITTNSTTLRGNRGRRGQTQMGGTFLPEQRNPPFPQSIPLPIELMNLGFSVPPPNLPNMPNFAPMSFNVNAAPFVPTNTRGRGSYGNRRGFGNLSARNVGNRAPRINRRKDDVDDKNLRDRLTREIEDNKYECMICFVRVGPHQSIWSCQKCYQMFHISGGCITEWARKSREEDGKWRCPGCNATYDKIPYNYYCFCGKERNPTFNHSDTPHTCGSVCNKLRGVGCVHKCTIPCHPGPCPECPVQLVRRCDCGKTEKAVRCGTEVSLKCDNVCGRPLNCSHHKCKAICHSGECASCEDLVTIKCHCEDSTREVLCGSEESVSLFGCAKPCGGMYECGKHKCNKTCHAAFSSSSRCGPCPWSPARIGHCPCGKETIQDLLKGGARDSCDDIIPTCAGKCNKLLMCGSSAKPHRCLQTCHVGPCPPCKLNSSLICECKQVKKSLPCIEYTIFSDGTPFKCERRCRKGKSCGIHKCGEMCCTLREHICMQICGKRLSCGEHRCDRLCHAGNCPRCLNASFEEQFCLCGRTMREPPIACGTPLPECNQPCARDHPCSHAVNHNCHSDPTCPPCTVLTEKWCSGNHELRSNIPCHLNQVSCGRPCGRSLSCGMHTCDRRCHKDECEKDGQKCTRPCPIPRLSCEHPCSMACHGKNTCPKSECKAPVDVTCECGRKQETIKCVEVSRHVARLRAIRAEEESDIQNRTNAGGIRILRRSASMDRLRSLPCDSECAKVARNLAMADALNIDIDENGDAKTAPTITYPDYLRHCMKTQSEFVKEIERVFQDLIARADDTVHGSSVSHNFRPMRIEARRAVHEYAEYFRIGTESVDEGPQRSVIATAKKGISRSPLVLISALAARYPHVLNNIGPISLNSDKVSAILNPKPTRTTNEPLLKTVGTSVKTIHRRAPIILEEPLPVKVSKNPYAVLLSDSEDEEKKTSRGIAVNKTSTTMPDPFDDVDGDSSSQCRIQDSDSEWIEIKPKEKIIKVIVEESHESLSETVSGNWDAPEEEREQISASHSI